MPRGINRSDPNNGGTSYNHGTPITLPHQFGNPITTPHDFGNDSPFIFGNPITLPHTFGNVIGGGSSPAPTVSSLNVTSGGIVGGTAVTLTGTGFLTGATVTFGTSPATSVVVVNPTTITCVTPSGSTGAVVSVAVTNTDSQSGSLASAFTYWSAPTVVSLNTTSGPLTGGTAVTLTGTGFQTGATVAFGSGSATSVAVVNSTTITCVTPSNATATTVNVTVTNTDTQSGSESNAFVFTVAVLQSYGYGLSSPVSNPFVTAGTPMNTTTGNLIVAMIRAGGGDTIAGAVTDTAGNTYTLAFSATNGGTQTIWCYYCANATGHSANALSVPFGGIGTSVAVVMWEVQGANSVSPVDTQAQQVMSSSPTSPITSGAFTTKSACDALFAAITNNNASVTPQFTPPAGWNQTAVMMADTSTYFVAGASTVPGAIQTGATVAYQFVPAAATFCILAVLAVKP